MDLKQMFVKSNTVSSMLHFLQFVTKARRRKFSKLILCQLFNDPPEIKTTTGYNIICQYLISQLRGI